MNDKPGFGGRVGKGILDLWDGSPPVGSGGIAPVGVWGEAPRSQISRYIRVYTMCS